MAPDVEGSAIAMGREEVDSPWMASGTVVVAEVVVEELLDELVHDEVLGVDHDTSVVARAGGLR